LTPPFERNASNLNISCFEKILVKFMILLLTVLANNNSYGREI